MPSRYLREGLRTSEKCAGLKDAEYRLFTLLILTVDDYGRYHADPRLVQSACYPFGGIGLARVKQLLSALESKGMLLTYMADGRPYLQLLQWRDRKRSKPKFPPMSDKCQTDDGQLPGNCGRLRIYDNDNGGGSAPPRKFINEIYKQLEALQELLQAEYNKDERDRARIKELKAQRERLRKELAGV
jgi:hypothetical protein